MSKRLDDLCNFVEDDTLFGGDTHLIYRHFATLYFIVICDKAESELGILDLIQVGLNPAQEGRRRWHGDKQPPPQQLMFHWFAQPWPSVSFFFSLPLTFQSAFDVLMRQVYVETLDKSFENVCELDIIFNQQKAGLILDQMITGGLVLETNSQEIVKR